MKLYLSSYGLGNQPEKLQKLVGDNKLTAVIVNALDWADDEKRSDRLEQSKAELASLGFEPEELDLRDYFGKPEELSQQLAKYGLLWIRGGNVFLLRRAMKQSGFDESIQDLVKSEAIVYAGFSAGSCAATPNLHGIEFVDDMYLGAEGYESGIIWEGLNFVPYSIAPHYRSDHAESEAIEETVKYFQEQNMPYKALHDGEAIYVHGDREEVVGWPNG